LDLYSQAEGNIPPRALKPYADVAARLLHGCYVCVGSAGVGKSLSTLAFIHSIREPANWVYTNESHATEISIYEFINWLKPTRGIYGSLYEMIKSGDTETLAAAARMSGAAEGGARLNPRAKVVLFDSATLWCWYADKLELVTGSGRSTGTTVASSGGTKTNSIDTKHEVRLKSSPAKAGGLTAEMQEFMLAIDDACVTQKRTVILTINSTLYPIKGKRGDSSMEGTVSLFKGLVSGVMYPTLSVNGESFMNISDRAERDFRQFTLKPEAITAALGLLEMDDLRDRKNPTAAKKTRSAYSGRL
jgi:hypothetical protein